MHEKRLISNVTVFVNVECVKGDRCTFVVCGFREVLYLLLHWYHILGLLYNRLLHFDPPDYLNPILTVHALYLTVIRNNILSTGAIHSLLHSMICVINRLLNDCCFLEHRYHDTNRRVNSTSLSADRFPRQPSKANNPHAESLLFHPSRTLSSILV